MALVIVTHRHEGQVWLAEDIEIEPHGRDAQATCSLCGRKIHDFRDYDEDRGDKWVGWHTRERME